MEKEHDSSWNYPMWLVVKENKEADILPNENWAPRNGTVTLLHQEFNNPGVKKILFVKRNIK